MVGYIFGEWLLPMNNIRSCKLSDAVYGHSYSSFVSYVYISPHIHMDRRVYRCMGRVSCASYAYMLFNDTALVSRFSSRIRCRWTLGVIGNKLCGWMWLYQHIPYYPDELGVSFEYLVSDTRSIYPPLSGISPHLCASMFLVKYAHWTIKRNSSKLLPRIIE